VQVAPTTQQGTVRLLAVCPDVAERLIVVLIRANSDLNKLLTSPQCEKCFAVWTCDHLCGLVVRVPACYPRGPGSIPGANRFSE
jgi:hypothetical protein